MSQRFWEHCFAVGLALAIGACCGCGTSEYRQRMAAGLEKLRQESQFNELLCDASEVIQGARVSVRVPRVFQQSFVVGSIIKGNKPVESDRVKPPLVELPEANITYEAMAPYAGGQVSYYCYLGAKELSGTKLTNQGDALAADLRDKFPNTTGDWADLQFATPEGGSVTWKKLRSTFDQKFYGVDKSGKPSFKQMPGVLEIYYRQDAGCLVVMCWRVPKDKDLEKITDYANLAAHMAGAVVVNEKE